MATTIRETAESYLITRDGVKQTLVLNKVARGADSIQAALVCACAAGVSRLKRYTPATSAGSPQRKRQM